MREKLAINGGKPVREKPLYYGKQHIDQDDINAVSETLKSSFLTTGPKIGELEDKLCKLTGAKYAVAVSNGTAALHAACYAAGISEGDEVIVSAMTFAASANCILYMGGKPVFADINPETYNIDPESIRKNITTKTKAVIAVDFTGQAVELDKIRSICSEFNLILIEDGAHSIGTKYKGHHIGNIADMTTFSFHPVKTVTSGEGGAILTNSEEFYKKVKSFRAHCIEKELSVEEKLEKGSWYYEQTDLGYNYRMTDIQAALLISQLDKLEIFKKRRKEIVEAYNSAFREISQLIVQKEIPESDTVRHLYILRFNTKELGLSRKEIFDALYAENICCNVHYIPVYWLEYYRQLGYEKGLCPNAEAVYEEIISLPLYFDMTDSDIEDVINSVRKIIENSYLPG